MSIRAFPLARAWLLVAALFSIAELATAAAQENASPATASVAKFPAAHSLAELRAQLDAHVQQPRFRQAMWGVRVDSLETGATLYAHDADRLQSPASNCKLYVAALALDRLGGDYRIATPLFGTAAPDGDGVLRGDLIVSGRGDPSWRSDAKRTEFWRTFERFIAVLQKAGVRRIAGSVIGDATFFRGPPTGASWTADDLNDYYGAEISALTLEDNYIGLRIAPGDQPGMPGALTWLQPAGALTLDNRTRTIAAAGARRYEVRRLLGENVVHVFGDLPVGSAAIDEDVTVPRPAQWFAATLTEALRRAGIAVEGAPRSALWPEPSPLPHGAVKLGEVVSPPLRELVHDFLKPSQNLETDLVFAHVGELTRRDDTPEWRSSEALAVAALREFLRAHDLPAGDVQFDEGSGLSRNNLATANATVALLRFMSTQREAAAFRDALPVAGVDGTLRKRMKATAAENNVHAKTGTLRWAHSLSGYVTSAAGERLVFSAMLNRAVIADGAKGGDEVDAIATLLAQFAARSDGGFRRDDR